MGVNRMRTTILSSCFMGLFLLNLESALVGLSCCNLLPFCRINDAIGIYITCINSHFEKGNSITSCNNSKRIQAVYQRVIAHCNAWPSIYCLTCNHSLFMSSPQNSWRTRLGLWFIQGRAETNIRFQDIRLKSTIQIRKLNQPLRIVASSLERNFTH